MDDLSKHAPDNPSDFGVLVQAMVGPDTDPGEESFDLIVCSPKWLERQVQDDGVIWGRYHMIAPIFDWDVLENEIRKRIDGIEGEDWREIALQIADFAQWEFDGYVL